MEFERTDWRDELSSKFGWPDVVTPAPNRDALESVFGDVLALEL